MNNKSNGHSKQRRKFQQAYIDTLVDSTTVNDLIEDHKAYIRTNLSKLSDGEFIELIKDVAFEQTWHIQQWIPFIEFRDNYYSNKEK